MTVKITKINRSHRYNKLELDMQIMTERSVDHIHGFWMRWFTEDSVW